MNKSLASLLVALTLSLGAAPAFAQTTGAAPGAAPSGECAHAHGGRGHRGAHFSPEAMDRRIARMTERLSLDASQVTRLREILSSTRAQLESLRASAPAGTDRRAAFQALRQETQQRIDAMLNPTQRAQVAQMRTERREHMGARRADRHGGAPSAPTGGVDPRGI